ncbi:hypothetical protein ACFL6I_11615 [candidate division KSB1 bacterium]
MSNENFEPRISNFLAVVLITVAITVDLIQVALTLIGLIILGVVLNTLISFFVTIFFGIVLTIKGVSFISARRSALTIITLVMEILPLANNIPTWTISTITMMVMVRKEDKKRFNEMQLQKPETKLKNVT